MGARLIPFKGSTLFSIIPSDSDTFTPALKAIFVGGATGDLAIGSAKRSAAGVETVSNVTYSGVVAGTWVSGIGPITKVLSTGTTATGIIGVQ